jgi:type III secretory pathway lipoprotein EscJ
MTVNGVVNARIVVSVSEHNELAEKAGPSSAVAFITYRQVEGAQPLSVEQLKRIVARGLPGLTPESVEIVLTPAPQPTFDRDEALVSVLGISLSAHSADTFKAVTASGLILFLALMLWIGLLYYRGSQRPLPAATRAR